MGGNKCKETLADFVYFWRKRPWQCNVTLEKSIDDYISPSQNIDSDCITGKK